MTLINAIYRTSCFSSNCSRGSPYIFTRCVLFSSLSCLLIIKLDITLIMDRVKLGKTHEWQTPEVQRFHVCSLGNPRMLVLMLEMNFISGLLANHTHNPQEESKKTIQIMLLIQLRIEKTRKCLILYFLSNYQSDSQLASKPAQTRRRNAE